MRRRIFFIDGLNEQDVIFESQLKASDPERPNFVNKYENIKLYFDSDKAECFIDGLPINEYSLVFFKSWGEEIELADTLFEIIKKIGNGVKTVNKSGILGRRVGSKLFQMARLATLGIRIPKTLYYSRDLLNESIYNDIVKVLGEAFVVKASVSTCGRGIFLIKNLEDFKNFLETREKDKNYIFQEFIDHKEIYRVMTIENRVTSIQKTHQNEGDFIINASRDCKRYFIDINFLDNENKKICLKISSLFEYTVCGMDIVLLKDGSICLFEVNSNPGIFNDKDCVEFVEFYNWIKNL